MRKWFRLISIALLLAGGIVLCAIRWQAWFGTPEEPQWTGDTLHYVFPNLTGEADQTSNSPKDDLTILVLGDIHNRLSRAEYDTLAARVPDAQIVLQAGDWMERGQDYYRQLLLREWTASKLYGLPVIACPGFMEYSKRLPRRVSPAWEETFPHPDNGPEGVPGTSYWVDIPHARIIVIDTNPLSRLVYLTRTLTWLRQAMYSADGRFTIVLMHHPVISSVKGDFNTLLYTTFRHALGEADLVIAGHDHGYMRSTPFVVLNTAGKPKEQRTIENANAADTIPVYGVLNLQSPISDHQSPISNLQFTVHRLSDGAVIDSLHVIHD